jgi:hypothetical protein
MTSDDLWWLDLACQRVAANSAAEREEADSCRGLACGGCALDDLDEEELDRFLDWFEDLWRLDLARQCAAANSVAERKEVDSCRDLGRGGCAIDDLDEGELNPFLD